MKTVNVYLNFMGNCEEAFLFYKSVFGGEFNYLSKFKDMPTQEGMPELTPEMGNKILHVGLPISEETCLMGSDNILEHSSGFKMGNNFSISVNTESRQEADKLFAKLSKGGEVSMPIEEAFWGDYFGQITDKFGINWMVMAD